MIVLCFQIVLSSAVAASPSTVSSCQAIISSLPCVLLTFRPTHQRSPLLFDQTAASTHSSDLKHILHTCMVFVKHSYFSLVLLESFLHPFCRNVQMTVLPQTFLDACFFGCVLYLSSLDGQFEFSPEAS